MKTTSKKEPAFLIRHDTYPMVQKLNVKQRGELLTALYEYCIDDVELNTEDILLDMCFGFMRTQIDSASEKYREKCERNAANRRGKKRSQDAEAPTLEELTEYGNNYCAEEGITIPDLRACYDYYQSIGWIKNGQPIVDWKAIVRNWAAREKQFKSNTQTPATWLETGCEVY